MDIFTLSRNFCNFAFDNPEKINPGHYAIYFFAIEHCNRLGWKEKFGFPSQMVMEATGIRNWRTYQKYLQDLIDFGFIKMIEVSKNQYSSNIIAIVKNTKALDKALDKALQKHHTKHSQSTDSIDIQETNIQLNKKQENKDIEIKRLKDKTSEGSALYRFCTFLESLGKNLQEELKEDFADKVYADIKGYYEKMGNTVFISEMDAFIAWHTDKGTIFKDTRGRLRTWFLKK